MQPHVRSVLERCVQSIVLAVYAGRIAGGFLESAQSAIPSSTASPDKDTPHHDDGPLAMVVADESEKKTPFQQIPGSRRPIARAASYQENFSVFATNNLAVALKKLKR
jgi:hypothetical protein